MSTQNPITLHLSLDELILIETVLEEREDILRHDAQLQRDLTQDEALAANFTKNADRVSCLREKLANITPS